MSDPAKIHLSKIERELIKNSEWILTKHAIIKKIYDIFGSLHESYNQLANKEKNFLTTLSNNAGKISKGENYESLPYVIMDYPSLFAKEKIVAVRTMFWWANFFSITLHVAGDAFKIKDDFVLNKNFLENNNFYICINKSQWQHGFEPSNYIHACELTEDLFSKIRKKDFLKISKKIEINKWDEMPLFMKDSFLQILDFINLNFPTCKTVL